MRLAFAIDSMVDIWMLERPQDVDAVLAQAMVSSLGGDVLIYHIGEVQGGYYGMARLSAIYASPGRDRADIVFDDVRMFRVELPYAPGITMLTRLQFLDDDEFAAIVARGNPADAGSGVAEQAQSTYSPPPSQSLAPLSLGSNDLCAFTGKPMREGVEWTVISPRRGAAGMANNLLALSPEPRDAFLSGHFSARDDLSILIDSAKMSKSLQRQLNPTGRLIVPDGPGLRPGRRQLADHRRFVFGVV